MKRYIKNSSKIYGGAYIDKDDKLIFNWNSDGQGDVVYLHENLSGEFTSDGVQYVYAYEYNPKADDKDKLKFRKYLKDLNATGNIFAEEVDDFVENAILTLDQYHKLADFGATVYTESSHEYTITDVMGQFFAEYCRNVTFSFELLKQTYADVTFDKEKAIQALRETGMPETRITKEINFTINKFEKLKKSGELFQMKRFIPREIRSGFENFLSFKDDKERRIYESLQGVDVLIYDDFLTSGATVREIIRYLRSFNDKNTLTVFVLVKQ